MCPVLTGIIQKLDLMMNSTMKISAQCSAVVKNKLNMKNYKKRVEKKTENITVLVEKALIPKSKIKCNRTGRGSQRATKNNQKYRMAVKGIHK